MSGHSKWETIKRQKGANDAKRGAIFTKLGNQIAIAARGGTDASMNASLALAVEKAKAANMPNANIQRAIDRVNDKNAAVLEEITYEGYGPGGVGLIIETATDNRNRTLPEVKNILVKNGGRIADAGSVMFQFTRKGVIRVAATGEDALLGVLDAGAEDIINNSDGSIDIHTTFENFGSVKDALDAAGLSSTNAEVTMLASTEVDLDAADAEKLMNVVDSLEDLDDVQNVYSNANISDEVLAQLDSE